MAVLQMQRISICGLKKDRKAILETVQRFGVIEVNDVLTEDSVFSKPDTVASQSVFEKSAATALQALDILAGYAPEERSMFSGLEGKNRISVDSYYELCNDCDNVMKKAYNIVTLSKEIAENKAGIIKLQAQIDALTPWLDLDVALDFKGTKTTSAFIGAFPYPTTLDDIYAKLAESAPQAGPVDVSIISTTKDQTCVFVVCKRTDASVYEDALRANLFARSSIISKMTAAELKASLDGQIEELNQKIADSESQIVAFEGSRDKLKFMHDYYMIRAEKYGVIGQLLHSKRTFALTGYIPEIYIAHIEQRLEKFDVAIEYETPTEDEDVPVMLKNNKFAEPVEDVLESYGLPGKGEMDPTPIMAIFYYVLFGMMLSDAAYGFVVSLVTGILLLKFKNMEPGTNRFLKMFFYCGLSTLFWGIMFSSYFGNAVDVIASVFFGTTATIPAVWFAPLEDPMRLLLFCMEVGVVHLFTGLALQMYQLIKQKRYVDAIYDVAFWYFLLVGLIFLLLPTDIFRGISQSTAVYPAWISSVGSILAGIGAVGIILTGGRESKNWFKRILKGLYALYNVTGYLSDVLSYSRLLALGLATGVIATVINQMGSMNGNSIPGIIIFVIVFILGHIMNMAINLLGAYVHSNRLEYVEFFGKFYEGGGKKFKPFAIKSKFYHIKEETK